MSCLAVGICSLVLSSAFAESLGTCTNTGYTFMGGGGVYHQDQKDYVLIGNAPTDGTMWAFGWLKFAELPTAPVDEAWLSLECYKDMNGSLTSDNPMDVTIYAVDADVAGITTGNVADFKENHIVGSKVATATLTGPGFYSWDIAPIVNGWIAGDNYGLAVVGWDDEQGAGYTHPYFAGLPDPNSHGMAPTLATNPVPEPGSIVMLLSLLGAGLAVMALGRCGFARQISVASVLGLVCLMSPAGHAETTVICPVNVDTYLVLMGGGCGYGYPIQTQVKSMTDWLTIPALVGFDLENLSAHSGSDVVSARFKFYRFDSPGGMMDPATAPAGTSFTATIHALDNSVTLTEELLPGEIPGNPAAHGVIDYGCNRPNVFGPGYSVSNDTGPNTWAEADITQIVRDWLDGGYANNGIEFQDDSDAGEYVWYWSSIQNAGNRPYLEVDVVPEPSSVALLAAGGLVLLGMSSRCRKP
jgi:hypothetical protein